MENLQRGVLISVEGIDGAGKTTLIKQVYHRMNENKLDVLVTKEPGGSMLGKYLRQLLHAQQLPICARAEYLLFAADRAQHMQESVLPALAKGSIVISDRMADSSLAYQAYGRGLDLDVIRFINQWTMEKREPDIIIFLDVPVEVALERVKKRSDISSFEKEVYFLKKVRDAFLEIFASKESVFKIDGTLKLELLTEQVYLHIASFLTRRWAQGQ